MPQRWVVRESVGAWDCGDREVHSNTQGGSTAMVTGARVLSPGAGGRVRQRVCHLHSEPSHLLSALHVRHRQLR